MTISIPLTQNQFTVIDDEDSDLQEFKWYASFDKTYGGGGTFIVRRGYHFGGRTYLVSMHRLILERVLNRQLTTGEVCDHINGNTLDNRRINLRVATRQHNAMNTTRRSDNKSGFKGVYYAKDRMKWRACIQQNGKTINLGTFKTAEEAYKAYCEKAIEIFGEFARFE